jgi:hypothetical protein
MIELNRTAIKQRLAGWGIMSTGVFAFLTAAWLIVFRDNKPDSTALIVLGALLFFVGSMATRLAGLGAWFLQARRPPLELDIITPGISDGDHLFGWENFSRWYQTENLLVLVCGGRAKGDSLAIPKRCCSETEWHQLLDIVRNALGEPAKW